MCTHLFYVHSFYFSHSRSPPHRDLHSFPTRRSSDLRHPGIRYSPPPRGGTGDARPERGRPRRHWTPRAHPSSAAHATRDRKSTRLNSSHVAISYAVFCLIKKKKPLLCRAYFALLSHA